MSNNATPSTTLSTVRKRHVTPDEFARWLQAVRSHGRHRQRDAAMLILSYQHGLRVSELCNLLCDDIDYKAATIRITRCKGSLSGMHPLTGEALRALRACERTDSLPWLFVNERGGQLTRAAVFETFKRRGNAAGIVPCNPHALRHGCGYKLVNDGTDLRLVQAYMGHKSIASTVIYAAVDARRFRGLF